MENKGAKGVGRPPKLTLDQKKDIVNRYLIHHGNDTSALRQYGINAKLARFAKGMDQRYLNVRGYDFSDGEIHGYMMQLAQELSGEDKARLVGCAYTPLDFTRILQMSKQNQHKELDMLLREREENLLTIYTQAANAMALHGVLEAKYEASEGLVREYKAANEALAKELSRVRTLLTEEKARCRELNEENRRLKRIVKQNEYQIAVLTSKGLAKGVSVTDDLRKLMHSGIESNSEQQEPRSKVVDFLPNFDD